MAIQLRPNVIHSRPDRMPKLLKEFKEQGITDYHLWEGVYNQKSAQANINLAHKQIIEWAKYEKLQKVLVFEDDIQFCGTGAFDYYLQNEPSDYDIYLGGIYLGIIGENNHVKAFTGMHCYIVHERFYDTFLNTPKDIHIDHSLKDMGEYIVCDPFIAIQHNGWSDNSQRHCNYDHFFDNRKLYKNK